MRRTLMVAALAAALSVPIASAAADSGDVVVRGLDFPEDTYLTYFGCDNLFQSDNQAPQVRIGSKGVAPLGKRSFGLLVPGSGTASGPVHLTDSVAATTASFSARADEGGSTGAAYVWYVTDDLDEGQVWAGRADLGVGAGWTTVDSARAMYSWQLLDAATGDQVDDAGTGSIATFTRAHGDGPGYMLAGLGCDGGDYSIDQLRYGRPGAVTTYDLEGLTSTNAIIGKVNGRVRASGVSVRSGTEVTLVGTADDGTGPMGAPMQLRAKTAGGTFKNVGGPVSADVDGSVRAVVSPKVTTTYRWYLADLGYTGDVLSAPFTVVVELRGGQAPLTPPSSVPAPADNDSGSSGGTDTAPPPEEQPEVPALPSQAPSPSGGEPSPEPTSEPSPEVTEPPAPETTETTEPAPGEATEATP